jgi:hypothetical protein
MSGLYWTAHIIVVALFCKIGHGIVSIITLAFPCRFVPVIVKLYPPRKCPVFGKTEVIYGVTKSEYRMALLMV